MIRRTFIKRFSAGVLGCGMLAEALLSRSPTMEVVETMNRPVAGVDYVPVQDRIDLGPRVRDRKDMEHRFEKSTPYNVVGVHRVKRGIIYLNGSRDEQ